MVNEAIREAVKAGILRSFTAREAELGGVGLEYAWRWNEGVILFPEGRCPWCKESMRSNRIWLVGGRMLIRRWKVVGGQVVEDPFADHPHVSGAQGGPICTGNAGDVITALFFSMNPRDTYWGRYDAEDGGNHQVFHEWLVRVWDHRCSQLASHILNHDDFIDDHQHCCWRHCLMAECRVSWRGGVRGCLCGHGCHPASYQTPRIDRYCPCGCNICECPKPPTPVEGEFFTCRQCEVTMDISQRNRCCRGRLCNRCHDG